jgi:hypothetical protein
MTHHDHFGPKAKALWNKVSQLKFPTWYRCCPESFAELGIVGLTVHYGGDNHL